MLFCIKSQNETPVVRDASLMLPTHNNLDFDLSDSPALHTSDLLSEALRGCFVKNWFIHTKLATFFFGFEVSTNWKWKAD